MPPVLVVDDDKDIRMSLVYLLELEGYTTLSAANGQEALDLLHRLEAPCIILLDLLMPVMDGIQFLEHKQLEAGLHEIPVVIISAATTVQPPAGVPFLQKPVPLDRLFEFVGKHCTPEHASA